MTVIFVIGGRVPRSSLEDGGDGMENTEDELGESKSGRCSPAKRKSRPLASVRLFVLGTKARLGRLSGDRSRGTCRRRGLRLRRGRRPSAGTAGRPERRTGSCSG